MIPRLPGRTLSALLLLAAPVQVQAQTPSKSPVPAAESHAVTVRLPHLGQSLTAVKTVDAATGAESSSAVFPDGRPADHRGALAAERLVAQQPQSKITLLLRDRLAGAGGRRVPVNLWLRFDPSAVDHRADLELAVRSGADVRQAKADLRARVEAGNLFAVEPALAVVRTLGLPVTYVGRYAPVIGVMASAAEVEALAAMPFTDRLYASITFQDTTRDAIETHRWKRVHDFGIRGDGARVAVLEDNGIDDAACVGGILNVVGYNNANHNVQDHPTGTASVVGSTSLANPGHARGIEILSANSTNASGNPSYVDTNIVAAADWAINSGADVVNCSFGFNNTPNALQMTDRYVDYAVRFLTTTFAVSAGNNGNVSGNVSTPGVAYNCITVGAIDDGNTPDWDNDVIASYSSVVDPGSTHGDREKPEVAAEGTNMTMLDVGCTFSYVASGTSFAAPGVAGMCGALMQMDPGTLMTWPEVMKAIMMAAATHNIEGASRLSDKDGAGGMNGLQAYRIVENGSYAVGTFNASSFNNNGYFTRNIWLQGGDRTRVVLCWDSMANSTYSTDVLEADLDITILQGAGQTSGASFGSSLSFDNPYEIVEFCPPATGWYTVRVNDFRFDGANEYYGLAWTQSADGRHAHFRPWLPESVADDAVGPTIGNPSFLVNPKDFAGGGRSFLCLASAGIGTGFDFPAACRHSFGDVDFLTYLSFDPANPFFLGFSGVYQIDGTTSQTRIDVPDVPALAGATIYLSSMTIQNTAPDGVKEIARFEPVTVWGHATDLNLGDDGFAGPIPIGFAFPFYGGAQTECWINANGNITFGGGDGDFTESLAEFTAGLPRIAPLWDDLNMNIGGKIRWRSGGAGQFVVEWVDVPEFATTTANQNSVMLILNADGTIEFKYAGCSLQDALIGISPGSGATPRFIDFTHGFQTFFSGAIYELFTTGFDLHTNSGHRNKIRLRPRNPSGYFVSFEGP